MNYSSIFANAADDLAMVVKHLKANPNKTSTHNVDRVALLLETLNRSQKFFLPGDLTLLNGREYDEELKSVMRLPFPSVAILQNAEFEDADGKFTGRDWALSLAVQVTAKSQAEGESMIHLINLTRTDRGPGKQWIVDPVSVVIDASQKVEGLRVMPMHMFEGDEEAFPLESDEDIQAAAEQRAPSVSSMTDLCALLAVENVKSEKTQPSRFLAAKRKRKGRSALPSYHVLVVDGEQWDGTGMGAGGGSNAGVRSHYRRGHIRRLSDGRRVWVRHTLVHGTRPGFADKEYHAGTGALH